MSPRVRLLLAFVVLVVVATLAMIAGSRRSPTSSADFRASTLVTTPNGASAFAETAEELGFRIERIRAHRPKALAAGGGTVVMLDPVIRVTGEQTMDLIELPGAGVGLLLVGPGTRPLLRCFGFDTLALADSVPVSGPRGGTLPAPKVGMALRPIADSVVADSSGIFDALVNECVVPRGRPVDTLAIAGGELLAVRFQPSDSAAPVTLVGDVGLFRNQTLRSTDAGPIVFDWLGAARVRRVPPRVSVRGLARGMDPPMEPGIAVGMARLASGDRRAAGAARHRHSVRAAASRHRSTPPVGR